MAAQNVPASEIFGPMSVEVKYNKTSAGEGPTVRISHGGREFVRMDLFLENPHYHINPHKDPNPRATARRVEDKTTPNGLLEHLLKDVTLRGLAQQAEEPEVEQYLDPDNEAEIRRYIYRRVEEVSQ